MSSTLAVAAAEAQTGARGAISLSGITRIFAGTIPAVDHIDLEIKAGEFFTLLGLSLIHISEPTRPY